ncbi:MAG: hypothetical protein Q6353_008475 [Candidatus Sigynarchaeum springense]
MSIAIVALILGFGSMAIGLYHLMQPQVQQRGVTQTWFGRNAYNSTTSSVHQDIGNLSISISVHSGEAIYALYCATIKVSGGSPGSAGVHVRFWLRNATWIQFYGGSICYSTSWESFSTQYLIKGVQPGEYSLVMRWYLYNGATSAEARDSTVLVQTLVA